MDRILNASALGGVKARDDARAAMDNFLAEHEQQAYRMAVVRLGDRDEALDAVQDAMWRMVRKYANKPREQWPPLFFRILRNRIVDTQRRSGRQIGGVDFLLEQPAADNPEAQLAQRDALRHIEQAIAELPTRQREVVMLRVWEGFDVATTARIMGCGQGSVKTHLSRAMRVLRSRVEAVLT